MLRVKQLRVESLEKEGNLKAECIHTDLSRLTRIFPCLRRDLAVPETVPSVQGTEMSIVFWMSLVGAKKSGTFSWAVLSDEQMSHGWSFSLLNDEQMSNKVRVEHQPVRIIDILHTDFGMGCSESITNNMEDAWRILMKVSWERQQHMLTLLIQSPVIVKE